MVCEIYMYIYNLLNNNRRKYLLINHNTVMQMTHLFYLKPRTDNMVNHLNGMNKNKQCPQK